MKIELGRFSDGRIRVNAQHEEDSSNFRKSDLSECLKYEDEKDRLEALLMVDWWNKHYHDNFEELWNVLRNIYYFKEKLETR